jgi:uncharacterized RDD family membrane protein YckC
MVRAIDLIFNNSLLQNHWFRRFLAALIDGIIMLIIWLVITIIIAIASIFIPFMQLSYPFFAGLLWIAYSTVLEGSSGATIGKQVLNMRVVSFEGPMGYRQAIIRNITKIYWPITLLDWIVGLVTEGDPRQRYSDRIANTTVIRTDIQEVFAGAYQPPTGPVPQPYAQQPGYAQGASPDQDIPQDESYPQQEPEPQPEPTPAPQQPEAVEPVAETAADQEKPEFTREELVNMRKDELIKIARGKNLKTSGTKRDIIDRLLGEEVP